MAISTIMVVLLIFADAYPVLQESASVERQRFRKGFNTDEHFLETVGNDTISRDSFDIDRKDVNRISDINIENNAAGFGHRNDFTSNDHEGGWNQTTGKYNELIGSNSVYDEIKTGDVNSHNNAIISTNRVNIHNDEIEQTHHHIFDHNDSDQWANKTASEFGSVNAYHRHDHHDGRETSTIGVEPGAAAVYELRAENDAMDEGRSMITTRWSRRKRMSETNEAEDDQYHRDLIETNTHFL